VMRIEERRSSSGSDCWPWCRSQPDSQPTSLSLSTFGQASTRKSRVWDYQTKRGMTSLTSDRSQCASEGAASTMIPGDGMNLVNYGWK
jgi:hypothetical protein